MILIPTKLRIQSYRKVAFIKYQEDMNKKAVVPTAYAINYTPVNNAEAGDDADYGAMNTWSEIGVSSDKLGHQIVFV